MNALVHQLISEATTTYLSGMGERDELDPQRLVKLVARRCVQCALEVDDPMLAMEMADLFGITQ